MLAVWFAEVEISFFSLVFSIMLSGGAGGMINAGRVIDVVDPSLTSSWFSVNFSGNFLALCFLHLCHSSRLLLISAPHPLLAYD